MHLDNGRDFFEVLTLARSSWSAAFQLSQSFQGLHARTQILKIRVLESAWQYEAFVHDASSNQFRMASLKPVLPEKVVSDAAENIQATFEEIHPCRGNEYTYLEETTLQSGSTRLQYKRKTAKRLSRLQAPTR